MILPFRPRPVALPRPSRPAGDASKTLDGCQAFEHPMGMANTDLLSTADVCRLYGVTRQTVRVWVADGLPLAPETPLDPGTGRALRLWFRAADVATYIEGRKAGGRLGVRGPDKAPRKPGRWPSKDANEGAAA